MLSFKHTSLQKCPPEHIPHTRPYDNAHTTTLMSCPPPGVNISQHNHAPSLQSKTTTLTMQPLMNVRIKLFIHDSSIILNSTQHHARLSFSFTTLEASREPHSNICVDGVVCTVDMLRVTHMELRELCVTRSTLARHQRRIQPVLRS